MESKARAVANVLVQTPADIHYIEWSDLMPILKDYPVFREDFLAKMVFAYQVGDYIKVRFLIYTLRSYSQGAE